MKSRMPSFAEYLDAVERLHRVDSGEIADSAGVSRSEVRRWRRGTHAPSWATIQALAARWGGAARLIYLGVILERFARQVGCNLEDVAGLLSSRRRMTPLRKPRRGETSADRRQLSLLSSGN